jgi:alpha-tubulin suppressor-like RCC1 family protein
MPCGAPGQACCADEPACTDNSYCAQGTCQAGCVVDVTFGRHHGCALEHDGTVWCSGANGNGQLGDGTKVDRVTPVQAVDASGPITDATAIAAGQYHTCAIRTGGTVWCWGRNGSGELGDGTGTESPKAVQVKATAGMLTGAVELAAGDSFTCARAGDGSVECWGTNADGELGDGTFTGRSTAAPALVSGAIELDAGKGHACTVDSSGTAQCWGHNGYGQLGNGTQTSSALPVSPIAGATAIAAGSWFTCALLADTTVQCWGLGNTARLGNGKDSNNEVETLPGPVLEATGGPSYQGAIGIALGGVACALAADHHVDCWGSDAHGQTGTAGGSLFPLPVPGLTDIDRIAAHYAHACAFGHDGSVVCWGRGTEGEFGDGMLANRDAPMPIGATCAATSARAR